MVARARCSALFTEASLLSSMSATSAARKPSTSLSTSTARCRGGRCWTAVTKASAIASLASYRASGPSPASGSPSSSMSGIGLQPQRLPAPGRLDGQEGRLGWFGPRPGGRWRAARSGTGWSRSGTARCAATPVPRTGRAPARRPATSPAARPRRPAPNRGSGSSAAGARRGTARSARRTPGRPRFAPVPASPLSPRQPPSPVRTPRARRKSSLSCRLAWCLN